MRSGTTALPRKPLLAGPQLAGALLAGALLTGAVLAGALLGACTAVPGGSTAAAPAPLDAAWAEVQRQAAAVAACDDDAQCHAIGVGHRACGGPSAYLAWSSQSSDGVALAAAVQRHAGLAMADNQRAGRASICEALPEPTAACNAKRCELQQR